MRTTYLDADDANEQAQADKWHECPWEIEPVAPFARPTDEERRAASVAWLYDRGLDADGQPLPTEDRA